MGRTVYFKIISEIAKENGYIISRAIDNVFELKKKNKLVYLKGKNFGLNSALSSSLSANKGQTFAILKKNNVPAVPHFGIYNPLKYDILFGDQKKRNNLRINEIVKKYGLPLVIKPAEGSSGEGVVLVSKKREIKNIARDYFLKADEVVLSPFRTIAHEYRVVVLDGKVELIFDKIRGKKSDFRHNLCLGATAKIIDPMSPIYKKLERLAKRSAKVLGLNFTSVDIIETEEFGLEVLEVNSIVSLNYFGAESKEKYKIAKEIYKKAFKKAVK